MHSFVNRNNIYFLNNTLNSVQVNFRILNNIIVLKYVCVKLTKHIVLQYYILYKFNIYVLEISVRCWRL